MSERRVFRIRFEKQNRITFSDGLHEMTIRRRRDPVREDTVRQLSRALGDGTLIDPDTVRLLGLNLYELIFFNGHANEWFERVYDGATDLRLQLEFHSSAAALMAYPWEFLYVPESRWKQGGRYLLKQGQISLVRRVVRPATDPRPVARPRFLVVDCMPAHVSGADPMSEAGRRCASPPSLEVDQLMALCLEARGEVHCLRFPSQLELMDEINAYGPDVVHLTGHGRFLAGDDAGFEFCLRPGETGGLERWEKDDRIAEAIGAQVPELVVLQTCKGGTTVRYEQYEGAAVTLVKRGVPNVVALQHEIPLREATRFVTGFYEALAQGRSVELAVREGRQALRSAGVASFGLPVAYVQRTDGFALPKKTAVDAAGRRRAGSPGYAQTGAATPGMEPAATDGSGAAAVVEPANMRPSRAAGAVEPASVRPSPSAVPEIALSRGERSDPLSVRFGRGDT